MLFKSQTETQLDSEIRSALTELSALTDKTSEDYGKLVDRISKLHKLKAEESPKRRVSPDTVLLVAANVFGILWLARFEKENVIKARTAMGFVMKPR